MLKNHFKKNWKHYAAIAFMLVLALIYFKPQLEGYGLKQHDIEQWKGMSHEAESFRAETGEEPLWTNSMFGGMPAVQISVLYTGNWIKMAYYQFKELMPPPIGQVFLHLIGFYILGMFLRLRPIVAVIGAVAFSFASYEIIIIQAGHLTKSMATAFIAPVLGAFIYSFRNNRWWGVAFSALFMSFELAMNHVQVTYYLLFVLLFVGIYFGIKAMQEKEIKTFLLTSAGIIGAYLLAGMINYGNIALTNDYAKHTIRGKNDITITPNGKQAENQSAGLDKDYITQWSYGIGETFTLLSPNVKGGGSFAIGNSQFEKHLDATSISRQDRNMVQSLGAYWGEQPFTSGPVYIGIISFLLAFLGLIFLQSRIKWALFAVTVLAVFLSWGKNFMGLTDFFIDYIPGYDKFRTVTIILIIVELTVPVLGMLFLHKLIEKRELLREKKKQIAIATGGFFVFLLLVKFIGLGDGYTSSSDQRQLTGVEANISNQLLQADPAQLKQQYGLDVSNPQQVQQFIDQQMQQYTGGFEAVKEVRKNIFHASLNRSLLFVFFGGGLVLLLLFTSLPTIVAGIGFLVLIMADVIPVAHNYLGDQMQGTSTNYKYWEEVGLTKYPVRANQADHQILEREITANPSLAKLVEAGKKKGEQLALDAGYTGIAKRNLVDAYRFQALNRATNYRVFDLSGAFQSSRASYFHKSLGGYHGAKLRNIDNLYDFHLSNMNNKVFNMLNVKYFIQQGQQGETVRPNPTAMGNAWLVKTIQPETSANAEILSLGTSFSLENKGPGQLLVNNEAVNTTTAYGSENLKYLLQKDSIDIQLPNGLQKGTEAVFVMDKQGETNLIPKQTLEADTADSFLRLANIQVKNTFDPKKEAVMLQSEAEKLSKQSFSGKGEISLESYAPNKLVYSANLQGKQFAVFSEIYYPDGWVATIDGKETPILKTNYLLRGLELPSGKHTIEFHFDLPKYHTSNTLAIIGSILLILIFGGLIFKEYTAKNKNLRDSKNDTA